MPSPRTGGVEPDEFQTLDALQMRLHQADAINTLCSKTFLWSCLLPHFVNVTSHRTNYPKDRQAIQASAGSAKKVLFTPTHTHRLCLSAFPTPSNCTRLGSFFHGQRLPFTNILRRLTPLYRYHRVFLFGHGGRLFLRIPEQANAFLKLVPVFFGSFGSLSFIVELLFEGCIFNHRIPHSTRAQKATEIQKILGVFWALRSGGNPRDTFL
mmetsp:Transcript_19709/g.32967  ORF Transcript_19709/g.32967 Transcript_19709/m.32967 type:complete len:210 (+) Transcript_19709:660-1289(+)